MLAPTHISELALYVDDLDRSVRFYTTLFGCETLRQDERFCALRINDGQVLLLFQRGCFTQPARIPGGTIPSHDGQGPLHACFGIAADSANRWAEHLKSLRIDVESRVQWPTGAISIYFRDPDGHAIELATPGIWRQS